MAGTSQLVCNGFIESDTYARSKADLMDLLGVDDEDIDDHLKALLWSLRRDPDANASRVGTRNLWVAVTPVGFPPLRIFQGRVRTFLMRQSFFGSRNASSP